jgi:hypothetical protein
MRSVGLVLCLLFALGAGYFVLQQSMGSGPGQGPPQEQIDVVAIRQRLLTIAQTERQYLAAHGSYASLEQLSQEDLLPGGTEDRGYTLSAVVSGSERFTITAAPTDGNKTDWPTLEVSENMQVTQR